MFYGISKKDSAFWRILAELAENPSKNRHHIAVCGRSIGVDILANYGESLVERG